MLAMTGRSFMVEPWLVRTGSANGDPLASTAARLQMNCNARKVQRTDGELQDAGVGGDHGA